MKRVLGIVIGALLGLSAWTSQASAGLFLYPGDTNEILFNDYENLFDSSGTLLPGATPPAPGDFLAGIFQVNRVNDLNTAATNIPDVTTWTGVFAQEITSVTPIAGGLTLTFKNPSLTTFTDGAGDTFTLSDLGPTKMFAVYADPVSGGTLFTFHGTMASNVASATDTSLFLTAGIDTAHDPMNSASANVFAPFPPVGVATSSLSIMDNFTGLKFSEHTPVTFVGPDGEFTFQSRFVPNSDPKSKWAFTSFDPAEVQPNVVPEVSSLWLLGMGLGSFGVLRRKKFLV